MRWDKTRWDERTERKKWREEEEEKRHSGQQKGWEEKRREEISQLHKHGHKEKINERGEKKERRKEKILLLSSCQRQSRVQLVQSGAQTYQSLCQIHSHSSYHQNKHVTYQSFHQNPQNHKNTLPKIKPHTHTHTLLCAHTACLLSQFDQISPFSFLRSHSEQLAVHSSIWEEINTKSLLRNLPYFTASGVFPKNKKKKKNRNGKKEIS